MKNVMKLPKCIRINNHAIKLEKNKQSFFEPIYILELLELKTLKIYIETNLANRFILFFKFPANASILFN